jgi:hypothetical protein
MNACGENYVLFCAKKQLINEARIPSGVYKGRRFI